VEFIATGLPACSAQVRASKDPFWHFPVNQGVFAPAVLAEEWLKRP